MRNKQGIISLNVLIVTLVTIGILLGIGFMVLQEFESNLGSTGATVTNESQTFTTGFYLTNNWTSQPCFNGLTVTYITNESDGTLINDDNYTVSPDTGLIQADVDSQYADTLVNVTYSYSSSSSTEACDGLRNTSLALNELPSWLAIVVILFVVGILLAIVFYVLPAQQEDDVAQI